MGDRVLVIGDTHCPGMRKGYVPFLVKTAKKYRVNRVVHIGDLVDWAAISFHEKHPDMPSPRDEYVKARAQVKRIHQAFPKADWMIGNHDDLPQRKAKHVGLPGGVLVRPYVELFSLDGWTSHERYATLEIDGVLYSHGDKGAGGKYAAINQAMEQFQSVVIGHHHGQAGVAWWANTNKIVFGMSTGCGIDQEKMQFEYGRKFNRKSMIGCGVVLEGKEAYWIPMPIK